MNKKLVFLIALLCAGAGAQTEVLECKVSHGLTLVEVRVNGRRATMLLDTGATQTVVSLERAGLAKYRLKELHSSAQGMTGKAFATTVHLSVSGREFKSLPAIAANIDNVTDDLGQKVDGILGADVLRAFKNIRIDFAHNSIELEY